MTLDLLALDCDGTLLTTMDIRTENPQNLIAPGALDILQKWQGKAPLFVASSAPQAILRIVMEACGLTHYFTGIYGSPPNKVQRLLQIIEERKAEPGNCVMVGDNPSDYEAARAAHMQFYGIGPAFKGADCPHHDDLSQLDAWLEKLAAE